MWRRSLPVGVLLRLAVVDRIEGDFAVLELHAPLACGLPTDPLRTLFVDSETPQLADLALRWLPPTISEGDQLILQLEPNEPCRLRAAIPLRDSPGQGFLNGVNHGTGTKQEPKRTAQRKR